MPHTSHDAELKEWRDIEALIDWQSLLIGNGASRAVWDSFNYTTLYEVACDSSLPNGLADEDKALFEALGATRNFEGVLGALDTAGQVCRALKLETGEIAARYGSIKGALVAAVHRVHIPWASIPTDALLSIRTALRSYRHVYSTNYDLLVYWAMMSEGRADGFVDYFFNGSEFDVLNAASTDTRTKVLYLHGALHLGYSSGGGRTLKVNAGSYASLLTQFGRDRRVIPLCVTEGTAQQKLEAIARSDYLSFALQKFTDDRNSIVVLGQGLGDTDEHISKILNSREDRHIAVGVYPADSTQIVAEKARYSYLLPRAQLHFFDSRSHPLGMASVKVKVGSDLLSTADA